MSTFFANSRDYQDKKWQLIDAKGQVLGRLASKVSRILMGKTRPDYTPHVETGDGVVVVNASKIIVTGRKTEQKIYKNYSGYPSGQRERTYERVMADDPTYALKHAVKGMLPKSRLGDRMVSRLLVYAGADHPHSAQLVVSAKAKASSKQTHKKVSST